MRVLYFEYNLYAEDTQIFISGKNLFFEFHIHAFN